MQQDQNDPLAPRARNAAFMTALRADIKQDSRWTDMGLKVSEHYPGTIQIERLVVESERGQGRGKEALTHLMTLADTHQVDLVVQPQALTPEGSSERLRAWYGRLGFQEDGRVLMRRRAVRARPPIDRER